VLVHIPSWLCQQQHVYFLITQTFYIQQKIQLMPSFSVTVLVELRSGLSTLFCELAEYWTIFQNKPFDYQNIDFWTSK
jgi:hypothetical protein